MYKQSVQGRIVYEAWSKGTIMQKKRCSFEECSITNQAQTGAVCFRYVAKGNLCCTEGCMSLARNGELCTRH